MPGRSVRYIRNIWVMLGVGIVLIIVIEGFLHSVLYVTDRFEVTNFKKYDSRIAADMYKDAQWSSDYFREFYESSAVRWESYIYWRRKPYSGTYININEDGLRFVPDPESKAKKNHFFMKLFMFGGSAMWGTGARDSHTIPALVVGELRNRGIDAQVFNFGEMGYVSTQEVIALLLQLQKGNIPDIVIFYDGVNDIFSSYQQGITGIPQNEQNRIKEFNITNRPWELVITAVQNIAGSSAIMYCTKGILRRIGIKEKKQQELQYHDLRRVAEETVKKYCSNMELVESLGKLYRFKCIFYWQPTIFGKGVLSDYEKSTYSTWQNMEGLFKEANRFMQNTRLLKGKGKSYVDLSSIFSDVKDPIFIDWIHLNERGNEIIAQEMIKQILPLIKIKLNTPR